MQFMLKFLVFASHETTISPPKLTNPKYLLLETTKFLLLLHPDYFVSLWWLKFRALYQAPEPPRWAATFRPTSLCVSNMTETLKERGGKMIPHTFKRKITEIKYTEKKKGRVRGNEATERSQLCLRYS